MCVFDRTEDRTNLNFRGNFYAAQKQDDCSEEQNSPSLFVKRKVQNAVVLGLEVADRMVKTTFKQLEKRFNSVYTASDFSLSIWTCCNTELQRVQVNQCQFCVLKPKENLALPSW